MTVEFDKELHMELKIFCIRNGLSLKSVMREALESFAKDAIAGKKVL